ncbi:MAG: type IV secretory system conjugative DNA transfer family protein [Cyanobacteria bacterium P01_F01_bin.86]
MSGITATPAIQLPENNASDSFIEQPALEYRPFGPIPPAFFLGGSLVLLGLLMLAGHLLGAGSSRKNIIGSARWAGRRERNNARKQALQQVASKDPSQVSLWINAPENIDGHKMTGDKNTIWIPNATSGTSVIGGSNTGKSYSVIKPTLRSAIAQGLPTVLLDTDYPGLAKTIAPLAESVGYEVSIFAPGYPESQICNVLDFVKDLRDSTGASQISKTLVKNFSMHGKHEDLFFAQAGELATEAALLLAKAMPHQDLLTSFCILKDVDMMKRIKGVHKIDPWLSLAFGQLVSTAKSEKTVDSIRGTAALLFGQLMRPDILPALMGESTIPLQMTGKRLLIFGVKQDIRMVVSPLIAGIINAIVSRNVIYGRTEPLFLSLDEMPSMYFPEISEWLAEKRKYGLCCQIGYQTFQQLVNTYGKELADVIFTNTATKFMFNPQHVDTAELVSRTLGDRDITYKTISRTTGRNRSRSRGEHRVKRRLKSADEILKMPQGTCIMINPGYAHGREQYIPMFFDPIHITDKELKIQSASESAWREFLGKRSEGTAAENQISTLAITQREAEFKKALPLNGETEAPDFSKMLK